MFYWRKYLIVSKLHSILIILILEEQGRGENKSANLGETECKTGVKCLEVSTSVVYKQLESKNCELIKTKTDIFTLERKKEAGGSERKREREWFS